MFWQLASIWTTKRMAVLGGIKSFCSGDFLKFGYPFCSFCVADGLPWKGTTLFACVLCIIYYSIVLISF